MLKRLSLWAWILAIGCSSDRLHPSDSLDELPTLLGHFRQAERLELFEGLPHQHMEKDQYERERARTQTIELDGYSFYATPISLDEKTTATLRRLVTSSANYQAYPGDVAKACGGFHPDWLLAATVGSDVYRLHICFGCHDFRIYANDDMLLWCEIADVDQLAAVLKPLRNSRPAGPLTVE